MTTTATRYHDFSCGHRVAGHESKCAHLHGHNYRVHFTVAAVDGTALDHLGRVLDFGEIKHLSQWCEENWDHKFLAWVDDGVLRDLRRLTAHVNEGYKELASMLTGSIVWVPFNPTAENMALHLLHSVGPQLLPPSVRLIHVQVDETRKCSAAAGLNQRERDDE